MDNTPLPHLAAVVFADGDAADAALAEAVATLNHDGMRVGGVMQALGPAIPGSRREMHVLVLVSGAWIRLDQNLGALSQSCVLDGSALAEAGQALRAAVAGHPDLLVVSRFGKQEALGGGMRADIAEAALSGIPTLIAVRDELRDDLERFLGTPPHTLPPDAQAIVRWVRGLAAASPDTTCDGPGHPT